MKFKPINILILIAILLLVTHLIFKNITTVPIMIETSTNNKDTYSLDKDKAGKYQIDRVTDDGITYTDLRPLLLARPDDDEILQAPRPQFLTDVTNPCFALTENYINVGNINFSYAMQKGYEIRCMPLVYQAGFTKSGTSGMFRNIAEHRLFSGHCDPDTYQKYQDNPVNRNCRAKEAHFWDNVKFRPNLTFDEYTRRYPINTIANSIKLIKSSETVDPLDDLSGMIYGDGTPRTIWHGHTWDEGEINKGLSTPKVLLPHKLYHVNPKAKILVTMRNPTSRLFSDFKFFFKGDGNGTSIEKTEQSFHKKVVEAVDWWKKCVSLYPDVRCAYGRAPDSLPELGFERCIQNKTLAYIKRMEEGVKCHTYAAWRFNSASRLRVGMYDIYINEWLKVFPREQFLFIKFEDYIKDPVTYIQNKVYPFLGLRPLTEQEVQRILNQKFSKTGTTLQMLPGTKKILNDIYQTRRDNLIRLTNDPRFNWEK